MQNQDSRQYPLATYVEVALADLPTGVAVAVTEVPGGATVIGGYFIVDTASDAATSDVIDIGDATDPDRYTASQINAKTAGATALDVTGFKYTATDDILVTRTETGAATVFAGRLVLEYVIDDRTNENQG